ncbi:MAG: hypothetical protein M0T80_03635 [Actinomycetota bacterium]|nr:hypothetical protein [Actinomycetota bacterium]
MSVRTHHLGVEGLSAALDGAADRATHAHLADCATCSERLRSWESVVARLRSADAGTLPASVLDGIVATALDPVQVAPLDPVQPVQDLAVVGGGTTAPGPAEGHHPDRWRRVLLGSGTGIAAAALVVLAVVGLRHLGAGPQATTSARAGAAASSRVPAAHAPATSGARSGSAGAFAGLERPAVVTVALGRAADPRALDAELRSVLGSRPGTVRAPAAASSPATVRSRATGRSPATVRGPAMASRSASRSLAGAPAGSAAVGDCLPAASRRSGSPGAPPILDGTVRLAGRPDEVYVYSTGRTWEVWVLSRGCATVTELHL